MGDSCKGCEEGRGYALRKEDGGRRSDVSGHPSEIRFAHHFREFHGVKRLLVAKELGETSLMFMVHPTLTEENMRYVVEQVKEVISHAKAL